jgi:hypothetical protein
VHHEELPGPTTQNPPEVEQGNPEQQNPQLYFDCSQHSLAPAAAKAGRLGPSKSRLQKTSFVTEPIHQTLKKTVSKKIAQAPRAKTQAPRAKRMARMS